MRRAVALGVALLAACSWSNSLFQARLLSSEADRDIRNHRPGDAQFAWGTMIVKAESAYARAPQGKHGVEALWLIGHGQAQTGDCLRAAPSLQRALVVQPDARWRQELLLELAKCDESNQDVAAISVYAALIRDVTDSAIRRQAHLRQGHLLVAHGEWRAGLDALEHDDTLPARVDRATALVRLGQADSALTELQPALAAEDSTIKWQGFVEAFAAHDTRATDTLLRRLLAFHKPVEQQRATWLLSAAQSAEPRDTLAVNAWLSQLAARPPSRAQIDGRMFGLQALISRAASLTALRRAVDSIHRVGNLPLGSIGAARLDDVNRRARMVVERADSVRAGAPQGDLALFVLAGFARDSLGSATVSTDLLSRLEREWPQSPYLGKVLIARIPLEPDSSAALIARFWRNDTNPYVAAANGDAGARVRVAELEDSLGQFALRYRLRAAPSTRTVQ